MVRQRLRWLSRGFSLPELLVVVAVIGITAALTIPLLVSYWHASTLTAGAQELQAVLNNARQMAIRQNTSVCIERSSNRVRYLIGVPKEIAHVGARSADIRAYQKARGDFALDDMEVSAADAAGLDGDLELAGSRRARLDAVNEEQVVFGAAGAMQASGLHAGRLHAHKPSGLGYSLYSFAA